MLASLASDQAIQEVIALYHEHFTTSSNAIDDVPVVELRSFSSSFDTSTEGNDLGTEYEATLSRKTLASSLGFVKHSLPILFNNVRHRDGLTRWTSPDAFSYTPGGSIPDEIINLDLHWHQLAGVHAILRACFTEEPLPGHCTGILVADEVGLGKTYQSAAVIACLADAVIKQKEKLVAAPLLRKI
jgi:SNF2 family DNA or RNA helicase